MIQSGKFDSTYMDIKRVAKTSLNFTINRLIEIIGIIIFGFGILLLLSILSYTPDDPNFIFSEGQQGVNGVVFLNPAF